MQLVAQLASQLDPGSVDAGGLAAARDLEHAAALWIRLAYTSGTAPTSASRCSADHPRDPSRALRQGADTVRYLTVIEQGGPAWDHARPMNEQAGWADHAAFMNRLDQEGFVVLGGPLSADRHTVLLIGDAQSKEAVHARLAPDPCVSKGLLRITTVVPLQILLGGKHSD